MAKKRKGNNDANREFQARMVLSEFAEQLANEKLLATPSELLVEAMNGNVLIDESKLRVERVIQLLRGQREYLSLIIARFSEQSTSAITEAYMLTLIDISFQLNESLSRYVVIPQIQICAPSPLHYFLPADSNSRSPVERAEVGAVMGAVLLAQQDQIQHIRQCSCGKYFVAGRIDQTHCSTKCRVKAHQSSEEFKAKRRKADRERYRLHTGGKVKDTTRRKDGPKKTR